MVMKIKGTMENFEAKNKHIYESGKSGRYKNGGFICCI